MKIDRLIYVKGRRSVGIQVKDGLLIVRAPKGIADKKLNAVLKEREGWINKKLAEYETCVKLNNDVISHKVFLFIGEKHNTFDELREKASKFAGLAIKKPRYSVRFYETEYRKLAAFILPRGLISIAERCCLDFRAVKIIKSKVKWGSCDSKGIISLNWRLIMLPESIIEYVITHELCHTLHLNHSQSFWAAVETYYKNAAAAKKYLKQNNFIIKLF